MGGTIMIQQKIKRQWFKEICSFTHWRVKVSILSKLY